MNGSNTSMEYYNSPAAGLQSILDAYRGVNEKRFTKKEKDDSEDNDDKEIGKSSGTTKSNKMEYGKKVAAKPSDCEESVMYEEKADGAQIARKYVEIFLDGDRSILGELKRNNIVVTAYFMHFIPEEHHAWILRALEKEYYK